MNDIEKEILSITQEECAEVIQAISKITRFGWKSKHPNGGKNNLEHLEEELGDLRAMIEIMLEHGLVREEQICSAQSKKYTKLKQWSGIFGKNGVNYEILV